MNAMGKMRASTAVQRAFNGQRRLRDWSNVHFGGMQAVKCHPLSICRFRPDEGGTVSTRLNIKLAPVLGYMRSNAYIDVVQVFVPYQAIEKMWMDTLDDAGVTEMTKRRLLAGQGVALGSPTDVSKAANIHPRKVGGVDRVSPTARIAYNAAVNHLRKHAYHAADQLTKDDYPIQPAVLSANVLERFNGVLDPERHIDGSINLTGELPLKGIGRKSAATAPDDLNVSVKEADGSTVSYPEAAATASENASDGIVVRVGDNGEPELFVDLDGTSEITLRDMIESQKLDGLIRRFAQMIKDDPINGEEAVERALYGLTVDFDANCHVLYRRIFELEPTHIRPTDGASVNDVSGHFHLDTQFATLVPRSELGGQLVTIAMVKPLETLTKQPDPAQTEPWELVNRVHDETTLDETLLTRADLESGVAAQDEDTPVFWVGHNGLKHGYATQGPNEFLLLEEELQSSMWTYAVPTSVTPQNVSYPSGGIDMYPFYMWNGPHAEYTINQTAKISTSLARGPNPVERIALFNDDPSLVDGDA